jgi:uridylate kinase
MAMDLQKKPKYKRVLLKLTGELFGGKDKKNIDFPSVKVIAQNIAKIRQQTDIEIAVVCGAGNLFRGRNVTDTEVDKATADYIGMLGTVMNALALQEEIEACDTKTRVMSALSMPSVCELFIRRKAIRHLEKGRIVILAGGTGKPFFTTDSAAALSACELNCDVILKGSNVDGVYSSDPQKDPNAKFYKELSYKQALDEGLNIMDNTAFTICKNENIPIIVFNVNQQENVEKIIHGEQIGTLISS